MTRDIERVYIRDLQEKDLCNTIKWFGDPDLVNLMGVRGVVDSGGQHSWFASLKRDPSKCVCAICLRSTDEHIGNVSLGKIDHRDSNAMFSIFIYDDKYKGLGYGTEAAKLLLNRAFVELGLHRVYLKTSPEYHAAISMYKKLGFKEEGRLRQHEMKSGVYVDKLIFGMLKHEFKK